MNSLVTNKQKIIIAAVSLLLLSMFWTSLTAAQVQGNQWSVPYALSNEGGRASEGYLAADSYGFVHLFWEEELEDGRPIIQYARFDGANWSTPFDIYVGRPGIPIGTISPTVDRQGRLHLLWTEGLDGPWYYSYVPVDQTLSAKNWLRPVRLDFPAREIKLLVDSQGVFHVLFASTYGQRPGVFYQRSEDQGRSWSESVWLDPDILPDYGPKSLQFSFDENEGLHAVWYYIPRSGVGGNWVRYARSLDGGNNWSLPFTIDFDDDESNKLRAAEPIMAVQGQTVHVIWGADTGGSIKRQHRFSTDAGLNWSRPNQIFGALNGQAFDGVTVDGAGRVHFFGQLRYPQGIYHAYWDQDHWSAPSLIYLVARDPNDPIGDRIHAHWLRPTVRNGNQLVLTFTDAPSEPDRNLYVTTLTLEDVDEIPAEPTPAPTSTPTPTVPPSPVPTPQTPTPTPETPAGGTSVTAPAVSLSSPMSAFWPGLIASLLLLVGIIAYQFVQRR